MSSAGSVSQLIKQVQEGQPEAAQELLARYFQRLMGLARKKLQGQDLRAADEEDVALSALAGFFLGARRGQYTQLHDRDDLWRLLVQIIAHKACKLVRRNDARKRPPGREAAEGSSPSPSGGPPGRPDLQQLSDRGLPPDLEVLAREEINRLLERLGDAQLRAIAVWKWEGYTNEEISAMLGCQPRTVERKLNLIRVVWSAEDVP
jgi:DNA-directed RNA polymerase specialized sigma24 family protein